MSLLTEWGEKVNLKAPWQEYPRMQMQRDSYYNLNGIWEYQITERRAEPDPARWKKIVVPYPLGSRLCGSTEQLEPGKALWYRKQFAYKPGVMHTWLNFEAVDMECTVFVNGIQAGTHKGGYTPFSLDISEMIKYQNALMVRCIDDSEYGKWAYGKQRTDHGGMWYTPSAGIWGTVWLEDTSEHAVQDLKITPDYDSSSVHVDLAGNFSQALVTIASDGHVVASGITDDKHYTARIENMHPWSTDDPFLYDLYVQTEDDVVRSYFGMRKFSAGYDSDGNKRFFLNNKPLFLSGLLDQGYSPDGLLTYSCNEAMHWELNKIKDMGYNMLRKHVKIECRRWYYECDRLGLLVMQDMPSGGQEKYDFLTTALLPNLGFRHMDDTKEQRFTRNDEESERHYYLELDEMLNDLYNETCIFAWVPFNEGWGQFDSEAVTQHIRNYDSTRLIDSASGWHDQGCGDFDSIHNYFFPYHVRPDKRKRIILLSECGGYTHVESAHCEPEKVYGYRKYKDRIELDEAVNRLYAQQILPNIPKGLSGCIYTQVSDVEDECNGIFTADRRIIKIDERKMRKMNERCIRRIRK